MPTKTGQNLNILLQNLIRDSASTVYYMDTKAPDFIVKSGAFPALCGMKVWVFPYFSPRRRYTSPS
uniref:Uncharacterized protein n=1 Tax=Phage sp. ctrsQ3 TaxID=2826752 RepID=A0A8S5MGP0_9VIRU|nr:MAG TPA: hypothetical protein [Phage sp. ctrsQ3]